MIVHSVGVWKKKRTPRRGKYFLSARAPRLVCRVFIVNEGRGQSMARRCDAARFGVLY
jgi:hypothetical protein